MVLNETTLDVLNFYPQENDFLNFTILSR